MKKIFLYILLFGALGACEKLPFGERKTSVAPQPVEEVVEDEVTEAALPVAGAQTAKQLDTTSQAERKAAAQAPKSGARVLGKTIASLGSPTEPGFWIKTPLVRSEVEGTVRNTATGKTATVMLIPIDGEATAGSRMSLSALRLIGASLTDLTEVEVSVSG